jgi:hypothetical protein
MRVLSSFCLFLFTGTVVFYQKNTGTISAYTSFVNSGSTIAGFSVGNGGKRQTGRKTFLIGTEYKKQLAKWFSLNGGIEYADHEIITVTGTDYPPFTVSGPVAGHVQLLSMPLYLRIDFLKYFFITSGGVFDLELKNTVTNNQSGIGATGGIGVKYDFKNRLSVFIHPYYQLHGVILFNNNNNSPERLLTAGIRTGVSYRF